MTTLESTPQGGDFAVHITSMQYSLLSLPVVNEGLAAVDLDNVAGMPVIIDANQTKASLVEVGLLNFDESDVNGFLIEGPKQKDLAASGQTAQPYSVLWSGQAVLNETKVPANDAAGNPLTLATIKTAALANIEDIRFVSEPEKTTTQTAATGS